MGTVDLERLRALIAARGMTPRSVSRKAKLGPTAVGDILNEKSLDPSIGTIIKIASALETDPADLLRVAKFGDILYDGAHNMSLRPLARRVPIMGEVAAGLFKEAEIAHVNQAIEFLPVDIPGYERASLYALLVVGRSMDRAYPPGSYVIVAPAAEAGVQWGDHVIVERPDSEGKVETTVKELVEEGGRIAFWPRSTDEAFKEPIYFDSNAHDQTAPRIVGVVVGDFRRRQRSGMMFDFRLPPGAE